MPFIPNPIVYVAWKFSGYSLAGVGLKRYYKRPVNPLLFSTIRVISGLLVGAVTAPLLLIGNSEHTVILVLWLIAVRVITWGLLVRFLYERDSENPARLIVVSGFLIC